MPLPPGFKEPSNRTPVEKPTEDASSMTIYREEMSFILTRTLWPEHRTDPNVIRFIERYMICRNVSQASREAGIDPRSGAALRRRPDIQAAIAALTDKVSLKFGYDAEEVVERVKEVHDVDPIDLENPDGTFKKHMRDIPPELRRAIKKMKVKNSVEKDPNGIDRPCGEIIEIEFYDKMKAAELLGTEKNIFKRTQVVQHDVTSNMRDILLGSRARAEEHLEANPNIRDVAETPAIDYKGKTDGN